MPEQYSHLFQFFNCYFHQDWMAEAHDAHAVIERFIRDSSRDEIEHVVNELNELLSPSQRE